MTLAVVQVNQFCDVYQEVVVEVRRVFLTPDGYYCFAVSLFEPRSIAA